MGEDQESGEERLADLELRAGEADPVVGGAPQLPDVSKTPSSPPGVPIPYPNTLPGKA